MTRNRTALAAALLACALGAPVASAQAAPVSEDLVISQVYGGNGGTYANDFVELFNRGATAVPLQGRSVQYASASGTGSFAVIAALPDVTLQPGQYFLVQAAGAQTGQALPAPDAQGATNLSATNGKVALVNRTTGLGCNGGSTPCSDEQRAAIQDLVGFGSANFFEGNAAAPAGSSTTAVTRLDEGCKDTGENDDDFTTPAPAPAPRNRQTAPDPCSDAPTVASTEPADGDETFPQDGTLTVTFSEPVDAAEGAFALACGDTAIPLTVTGGAETFTLDPQQTLTRGADCTLTIEADAITDRDGEPTHPEDDTTVRFHVVEQCGDPLTTIPAIQGATDTSPLAGDRVSTEGVVVGDFQGAEGDGDLDGFFLQDPEGDGDRRTSDGVFVYDPDGAPEVREGDRVRVRGTVTEFRRAADDASTLTEITDRVVVTPCATGTAALPPAAPLVLPQDRDRLERLEGMRVRTLNPLSVTELYNLGFGEVVLSAFGPLTQPTEIVRPGRAAATLDRLETDATILLDDGRGGANLNPILFTSEADALRRGDTLRGSVTGALSFDFDTYRIQPTTQPSFAERNSRPQAPENVGGDVSVGSFNVLNYFVTFGRSEDRGADNAAELAQQEAKIVAAINRLDASILGLQEVQDTTDEPTQGNDPDAALDRLVGALNAAAGYPKWAKSPAPQPFGNTDEIRVAQIYQPAKVERVGDPVAFPDPAFVDIARVPIAQTYRADGDTFTVISNHFKSKGCDEDSDPADADQGDGQSCFNATRVRQASKLLEFIAQRQEATGDQDVLAIGDFNSYSQEDPVRTLERGGLTNLHERFERPSERYSYVFNGRQGVLDHDLATRSLARKVTGADIWHINADEARAEQYDQLDPLYTADPFRASDHDPSKVGLELASRRR